MGGISVYLENGFEHDVVTVSAGGPVSELTDVTTRYQIGLARVVELAVPDGAQSVVRIALPVRGLAEETRIDPVATPHVRVDLRGGALDVRPTSEAPMFG